MDASEILITCASWEERFILGIQRDLDTYKPSAVLMFHLDQYEEWSADSRMSASAICAERGVKLFQRRLNWDQPASNWRTMREWLLSSEISGRNVVVDVTTMPRDVIWSVLWLLEFGGASIRYVYHRPNAYNRDWLSRDPGRPRLAYKMGGVARLGARTALVIIAGFDRDRTGQLIQHFEPSATLIGLQVGDGDTQNDDRMRAHAEYVRQFRSTITFELDAYKGDHGQISIAKAVSEYATTHNIIVSSLGPKLSAISLYRLSRQHPDFGLAYTPSREYNRQYSSGLRESYSGTL